MDKGFVKRLIIGTVALGVLSAVLIATGKWQDTVVNPVAAMFGQETADRLDAGARENVAKGQQIAEDLEHHEFDARELLGDLEGISLPKQYERKPKYERELFGDGWQSDLDGCSTREQILMRDLQQVTMRSDRKCKVATGTLDPDPYTGKRIAFSSVDDPQAIQIDHIVPLKRAWEMGAWKWDSNERVAFANDPANLVAADGPQNNSKSDKGPARWMVPKNPSYTCEYAARYVTVTEKYELTMEQADHDALRKVLDQC